MSNNHTTDTATSQPERTVSLDDILHKAKDKKTANARMIDLARDCMPSTRLSDAIGCGNYLTFLHDNDFNHTKLETGFFCKNRLCPSCAWRKSARDAVTISCILQHALSQGYELVFATLTAENVTAENLRDAIHRYDIAYTDMLKRGNFRNIKGAIRKLEVTYNHTTNTYHPHIHSIWFMPKGWRRRDSKAHIDTQMLSDMWYKCLKSYYAVSPKAQDIRIVKTDNPQDVAEFAKYPAKSCDYLVNKAVFETFYEALKGIRLITFMRDARKFKRMYKDGELNQYAEPDRTEYFYRTHWTWYRNDWAQLSTDMLDEPLTFEIIDTDEEVE